MGTDSVSTRRTVISPTSAEVYGDCRKRSRLDRASHPMANLEAAQRLRVQWGRTIHPQCRRQDQRCSCPLGQGWCAGPACSPAAHLGCSLSCTFLFSFLRPAA